MALHITYRIPSAVSSGRRTFTWYVGEKLTVLFDSRCDHSANTIEQVICVAASGDELAWVEENFRNVAMLSRGWPRWCVQAAGSEARGAPHG